MRNLHKVFFLSLFGLALAAGCTVTTSDNNAKGGQGGEDTTGTGGKTSAGGTTGSGGTTTTAFTAADCATAAATVPADVPDVTAACIACIYGTGCADAVTCRNDGTCMASTLKALECVELYFLINSFADPDAVQACQDGTLTAADTPTAAEIAAAGMTVKSTDAGAWLGAVVSVNGTSVLNNCALECHLSDT